VVKNPNLSAVSVLIAEVGTQARVDKHHKFAHAKKLTKAGRENFLYV
jgi:hypothetical protein